MQARQKRDTLRTVHQLVDAGLVGEASSARLGDVAKQYAVAISPQIQDVIASEGGNGPVAQQFVPSAEELLTTPEELTDPIGDHAHSPVPGIVHRYPDRVLLKAAGVCPVYCRYCFRREMVGPGVGTTLSAAELAAAFEYIAARTEIWEVIVTGGDPLVMSPRRLSEITARLDEIPHVKVLRWHTRVPCVQPDAVSDALAEAITSRGKMTIVAVHANHASELTTGAREAIKRLRKAGIMLVSQTVLLRGVNDSVEVLERLMRAFVEAGIKPYYLHHPDLAPGTSHFRLSLAEGQAIVQGLRGRLSGIAQPLYVLDIPGGYGKVPAGASYVETDGNDSMLVRDVHGGRHTYRG